MKRIGNGKICHGRDELDAEHGPYRNENHTNAGGGEAECCLISLYFHYDVRRKVIAVKECVSGLSHADIGIADNKIASFHLGWRNVVRG